MGGAIWEMPWCSDQAHEKTTAEAVVYENTDGQTNGQTNGQNELELVGDRLVVLDENTPLTIVRINPALG